MKEKRLANKREKVAVREKEKREHKYKDLYEQSYIHHDDFGTVKMNH